MKRVRVLVADDSATMRHHLCNVLAADSDFEVVGEAEDGKRAIELCQDLRPDVVTMDMMMPVMTGLAATEYIMAHCPTPILVVSSSLNRGELFKTYDALAAGAVDVLDKPSGAEPPRAWERGFLAAVKVASRIRVVTHRPARVAGLGRVAQPPGAVGCSPEHRALEVVAIGASTGGPGAIVELLRALPPSFRPPILLVLHIAEPFAASFADWLDGQTARRVALVRDGEPLASFVGRVAMAPPDRHLVVRGARLHLSSDPPRHSCRPSIDVLLESVAQNCGASAAGCLLTGMGCDGARGLFEIRRSGGLALAQDEASCVVYGMPRAAAELGAAEHVLPPREMAAVLATLERARAKAPS